MEMIDRNPEDILNENLMDELTKQINQSIIDKICANFSYLYWNPENRKKYADKFQIRIVGDNLIPYKVQHYIHEQIEKEINQGYIERKCNKINLDDIHHIVYIYNPDLWPNEIIRMHQTESEYQRSQNQPNPIFAPYYPKLSDSVIDNFNFNNSIKYTIKQ